MNFQTKRAFLYGAKNNFLKGILIYYAFFSLFILNFAVIEYLILLINEYREIFQYYCNFMIYYFN